MIQRFFRGIKSRHFRSVLFGLVWTGGLIFGGFAANQASDTYLLLMHSSVTASVSITGLLAAMGLPFLFVFLAVYISRPGLIYPICFLKACSFSLTGFALLSQFGSAGWLVRFLLQFADMGALALLCLYALRHLDGQREKLITDSVLCALVIVCLGCMDRYGVSLFLAALM